MSSDGLLVIISDILDFSKIEAGQMSLEQIEFDVVDVAERALMIFAPVARAKGVQLYGVFGTASALPMRGDPVRVGQIVHNLLSNAIKFTSAGKVSLRLSTEAVAVGGTAVVFDVDDTGIGMSPEQQRTIFQAFTQADSSITRRYGGSGLGLTLSRLLAEAMDGTISVASKLDEGSRFTLRLPMGAAPMATSEPTKFSGEQVVFLSHADEWRDGFVPRLEASGLHVDAFKHPALITDEKLEAADALVVCGDRDTWRPSEENRLVEEAPWVIDCHRDGPAQPVRTGRIVSVSCYSLKGLEAALCQVLRGEVPASVGRRATQVTEGDGASLPAQHPLRVLVAEDNPVNQQLFAEQLAMLGCESHVAGSGAAALEMLATQPWNILLTDLDMPDMSGFELAAAVHKRWPSLQIMAVTAHASVDEHARCEAAGMQRVLTKPLSLGALHDVLAVVAATVQANVEEPGSDRLAILGGQSIPAHLREVFTESCGASLVSIRAAQAKGDTAGLLAELHSMTGALNVFGQKALAQQCSDIGQRARLDGMAGLSDALHRFDAAVRTLIER